MSDSVTFLRQIKEQPNDDTVRLVYADWLDDHADDFAHPEAAHGRAEFIRLQCEWARGVHTEEKLYELVMRCAKLRGEFGREWAAEDRVTFGAQPSQTQVSFHRGFAKFGRVEEINQRSRIEKVSEEIDRLIRNEEEFTTLQDALKKVTDAGFRVTHGDIAPERKSRLRSEDDSVPHERYFNRLGALLISMQSWKNFGLVSLNQPALYEPFLQAGLGVREHGDAWAAMLAHRVQKPIRGQGYLNPQYMQPLLNFLLDEGLNPNLQFEYTDITNPPAEPASTPNPPQIRRANLMSIISRRLINEQDARSHDGYVGLLYSLSAHGAVMDENVRNMLEYFSHTHTEYANLLAQLDQRLNQFAPSTAMNEVEAVIPGASIMRGGG